MHFIYVFKFYFSSESIVSANEDAQEPILKKKLIFILSSNYSGSHFLSLMLGSHSKGVHLGELKNVYKKGGFDKCYVCQGGADCELFRGIDKQDKSSLYDFLFSRAEEDVTFLVDASKKPRWFRDYLDIENYDVYLIHLVRDPRALARRWLMRFSEKNIGLRERIKQIRKNPAKIFRLLFGDDLVVCLYKWISQNRDIARFTEESGFPYKRVTYKDLAINTDSALRSICSWIGLEYEPAQKEYWRYPHHGSQKEEYQWIKKQGGGSYFDQRWKSYLTESQVNRIESHKDLNAFLGSIHMEFSEEGLEHAES